MCGIAGKIYFNKDRKVSLNELKKAGYLLLSKVERGASNIRG